MLNQPRRDARNPIGRTTRRSFLLSGVLGGVGLAWPAWILNGSGPPSAKSSAARSVIIIFNLGGPSHLDLFDMKPEAPSDIRGPFKPIRTVSPDMQISELLPLHAKVADKFSLVRTCHHFGATSHEAGTQIMLPPTAFAASRGRLGQGAVECDVNLDIDAVRSETAFDLTGEPAQIRERYGMSAFGQNCLRARRLVESGTRFVSINTFRSVFNEITWDIHGTRPFSSMAEMANIVAPIYDKAYSALIEDLDARGLLASTLVCNLAEFGRTPRINAAGGRDHWPHCFTCYFAGGGVRGGRVVGRSDALGAEPADRPVEPDEIIGTIDHCLGLRPEDRLPERVGQLMSAGSRPHRMIHELF